MSHKKNSDQVALIKLQLLNLYGFNVYRNLKDPKEKRKKFWLGVAYVFVIAIVAFYVGAMCFGYVYLGLGDILPAYLIMLASLIILMFSIFKAGNVIFQRNAYDILSSMPLKQRDIVISRFVRLYVENLVLTMVIMLPAMVVYGVLVRPALTFFLIGLIVTMFIPLIPIAISVFVGALITAVSSRTKHKNLVSIVLSMALVVGVMLGSTKLAMVEEVDIEQLQNMLGLVLDFIGGIYPPAIWLGEAMLKGDFVLCFACVAGGVVLLGIVIALVSATYKWVSQGLYSTHAKHDYQMKKLQTTSILGALYKREFKRYFASSIYVTNTIVSPVMGMLFAVAMLFVGPEMLQGVATDFHAQTGVVLNMNSMIPMALGTVFCMLPITAVSISMEGKQWWIAKSLPIKTEDILNSKLLMHLSVIGPFYFLAVLCIIIGQRPGLMELLWLVLFPLTAIIFSCVFAQTANLKLAVFDWENEVTVVKQSASSFVGGIIPFFVMMVATVGVMMAPVQYTNLIMLFLCLLLGLVALLLYRKNRKVNLINL